MFQHLVESVPRRIKAVLKAKGVQPGTSKVYLIKWPVSVCVCICVYIYIYICIHSGYRKYSDPLHFSLFVILQPFAKII